MMHDPDAADPGRPTPGMDRAAVARAYALISRVLQRLPSRDLRQAQALLGRCLAADPTAPPADAAPTCEGTDG